MDEGVITIPASLATLQIICSGVCMCINVLGVGAPQFQVIF